MEEKKLTSSRQDINDNKVIAAIGYIGVLCLIPLLLKKDSKFAQFHGKQGLTLFVAEIVVTFLNIIPLLGQLVWIVLNIVFLAIIVQAILKALNGEYWQIPILGEYAKNIKL